MKMTRNKTSEEMNIDEPFESICRLCADMTSTNTFIPLYTADKQEQIVTKQINQLIINLISPNDGLPQEICLQCAENVAKYYAFVTNIIETQNKLRRIIQLPEIKRINHMNNSQTQFLQHDQSQNVTAVEYGLQKSSISRLNEYNKNYSPKENRTTNNEDRSKIEPHAKPTIKPFQCLRPIMEEKSNRSCLRLYRCGSCFEKYKSKEDCLRHIVENHAQVKKPVSPNTIFEMVYKNDDKIQFRDKNQSNVVSPIQNKSDVLHKAFSNGSITSPQTKVQNESPNKYSENKANLSYKNIANCENLNKQIPDKIDGKKIELKSSSRAKSNQVISMRMRGNQRKILHVDSFYKEIRKQCTRYICDVCGRIMTSKFAFQRHVNDHCGPNIKSEDTIIKKQEKLKQPLLNKRKSGYCKLCRKRISHWTRHAMYHAILKLEKKYPDIVRVLNSSS